MPTTEESAQQFWSMVWRCDHRHPCKRCCWPWIGRQDLTLYEDLSECYKRRQRYGSFMDKTRGRGMGAHIYAYALGNAPGMLIVPGRFVVVCHQCDYRHCCNYAHLSLGAQADNMRDRRGKIVTEHYQPSVYFPDGRRLYFYGGACHLTAWDGRWPMVRRTPVLRTVLVPIQTRQQETAGDRIRIERARRRIYQKTLAEMAGISVSGMVKIEHHGAAIKGAVLERIADALGVTTDYLLKGKRRSSESEHEPAAPALTGA